MTKNQGSNKKNANAKSDLKAQKSLDTFANTKIVQDEDGQIGLDIPYNADAEDSVIGGLILSNDSFDAVAQILEASDFYQSKNNLIFSIMNRLSEEAKPFELLVLIEELRKNSILEKIGGEDHLAQIAAKTPTVANLLEYAKLVKENSIKRKLIKAATSISNRSYTPKGRNADELLDLAEADIFAIAQNRTKEDRVMDMPKLLTQAMVSLEQLATLKGKLSGIATGYSQLDELTSGLQRSDLIILAGRPSMGKTSLAMNIVENILTKQSSDDGLILVFSMEMPSEQLMMRMLASVGMVDQTKIRKGELNEDDWNGILKATKLLQNKKFFIDDTPNLTPNDAKATARRLTKQWGKIDLIVLDYLQLMHIAGASENRTNEISEISRSLKAMAKEFNCPVVALSQLNRSLENRSGKDKRPIMSDLRESGAIEQDADVIAFVYRDEVYHKEDPANKGLAELIIGKQRNGPIGTVHLKFISKFTRFYSLELGSKYDDLDVDY